MANLEQAAIFLSASFPSGERGQKFKPYDASAVVDAVSAFCRAVLGNNGRLVFGGHPTITPLVLTISSELQVENSVSVFQSKWFEDQKLSYRDEIVRKKLGRIVWTPKATGVNESLQTMRKEMIDSIQYKGAIFIGGMEGIQEEYLILDSRLSIAQVQVLVIFSDLRRNSVRVFEIGVADRWQRLLDSYERVKNRR